MDLTQRQTQILKCIIEEYMAQAVPIGSEMLEKKHALGISPATIRNEMVALTDKGYLQQPHTSAGRTPTSQAIRFYVDNLMQEKKLSVTEEVKAKEEIWDVRQNFEKLMREAVIALAHRTRNLAVIATNDDQVFYAGASYMAQIPEFYDTEVLTTVLAFLDEQKKIRQLFFERNYDNSPVHVVFGSDLDWAYFEPVTMAFTQFHAANKLGTIGIIGPYRMNFPQVLPNIRYFANLLTEVTHGWR
jgi:heat-inducible transcriptional repressor